MKTFHIINFGCRATQSDGAAIEHAFLQNQLGKSQDWQNSDLVVVNTCTVTESADAQARQMIRRVHRENPSARIVVTGCYAQRAAEELARVAGVTCVIGNSHKEQLVPLVLDHHLKCPSGDQLQRNTSSNIAQHVREKLADSKPSAAVYCSSIFETTELRSISDSAGGGRTRPVLKIQDGCSYRCSYCVIPYVRGDSRSLSEMEVLRQATNLLDQGYKEIVLTGIHLGAYGRDLKNKGSLFSLLEKLLRLARLERLRLSSVEPLEMTAEVVELIAESPQMAKHFHLPLQSGSDRVLRLMRRPYSAKDYARLVERVRRSAPDAAIGADVMVGFPTETKADHELTKELVAALPMTYLHVFPYSERPGTASANLRPVVPSPVAQQRSLELRQLATEKNLRFRRSFLGKTLSVITLAKEDHGGGVEAISSNYLKVEIPGSGVSFNQLLSVEISELTETGLKGKVTGREGY
ncbi:MAG TPA: tRNA (N(6)-L-threonylcarbamoyladenosine(37)-C(2))-methylthiotransferase MtaB [Terriglobia bacterium]|nr:tRNA (N(6)-L-threonylcarbamoyladenosine(37)-C(2))-methylthiotransferase MtaB [Terriglobia bacterium]